MKFNKLKVMLIILMVSIFFIGGCSGGNAEEGKIIKIGKAPYDYEVPFVEITKQIAEEEGYEVQIVEGEVGFMFMGLVEGDIDIWSGIWLPAIHETYHEKYKDDYELGSEIFTDAHTGWVVPKFLEEINSIEDIKGNEDLFNGKLTGFEPGSGMMLLSEEVIEGYDLDLEVVSGSMASMMAEVDYSIQQEEPIVFLGWRPHIMMRNYDLKFLEDPKGYWDLDGEFWGIRHGFEEDAPDIYSLVKNFKMSIDETEEFLFAYQEDGKDIEELAREWIENNRDDINNWLGK